MKTMKCDLCEFEGQGETFENWAQGMQSHYSNVHGDWMTAMANNPNAKEDAAKWMADAQARFDAV